SYPYQLTLMADNGVWNSTAISEATPGQTTNNSQCTISANGLNVQVSGNTLTVTVPIAFAGSYDGAKNVYELAGSSAGQSGWSPVGTFTVGLPPAPTNNSVSPSGGSSAPGQPQTFTFTYGDSGGAQNIAWIEADLGPELSAANSCFFIVAATYPYQLTLMADSGTWNSTAISQATPGQTTSSSQCSITSNSNFTVQVSGNTFTVTVPVTFSSSYLGSKNIYLLTGDNYNQQSQWQAMGTWTVANAGTPSPVSISPNSGTGPAQTFTAVFSDTAGYAALAQVYLLMNSGINADNACMVRYDVGANVFYLVSDGGSYLSPIAPGSGGADSNSRCTLSGAGSTVSGSGTNLTVHIALTFEPLFDGTWPLYLLAQDINGAISGWADDGAWTVVAASTVPITVTTGPSGLSLTVDSVACTAPCTFQWTPGSLHTVTATSPQGTGGTQYAFSSWSDGGAQTHSITTPSAATTYTAAYTTVAPPLTLPGVLKGVTYFPRGHAWYRMLYDWYSYDCVTSSEPLSCVSGETVASIVSADLAQLKSRGINFIHLFLWDTQLLKDAGLLTSGPGFNPSDPTSSSGAVGGKTQWQALEDFVAAASQNGIYLDLHFAAAWPADDIAGGQNGATVGEAYATWVNSFITDLTVVRNNQNILIWGINYSAFGPVQSPSDPTSIFWQTMYPLVLQTVQQHPYPTGRALLAVDANFYGPPAAGPVLAQLGGYHWTWQQAQQNATYFRQQLNLVPDIFNFQLWNANSGDLDANLQCLAGQTNSVCPTTPDQSCSGPCDVIPFNKMVATEFGAGSSMEAPLLGDSIASYGDANEPTTTAAGQVQWLTDTLCVFSSLGLPAYVYHGLYDSASMWEEDWDQSGQQLAWNGYWGLTSETGVDKPARQAFMVNPSCSAPPTPVIALQSDATQYTIGDSGKI
ncbi:MAG: hypothetical protein ACRD2O_09055, partial [Terriglobia bacterium]